MIAVVIKVIGGSSPRVRGKDIGAVNPAFQFGIIPACAGKRAGQDDNFQVDRDHPRVCGEKKIMIG